MKKKSLKQDCAQNSVFYVYFVQPDDQKAKNLPEAVSQLYENITANCAAITDPKNDLLVYYLSVDLSSADHSRLKRQVGSAHFILKNFQNLQNDQNMN